MNSMRFEMAPRQTLDLKLAPRMIQTLEILQLPIMALQERIEKELQENPVLELAEHEMELSEPVSMQESEPDYDAESPSSPLVHDADSEFDFQRLDALDRDLDGIFNEEHRSSRNKVEEESEKRMDVMQNMPSRPISLQDYLTEQISFLTVAAKRRELAEYLISNLDERGYLSDSLLKLGQAFGTPVSEEDLEEALDVLHRLDPPGVGARDLKECLLLQIGRETRHPDVVRALIEHHLEDIQFNRLPLIQKRTGFDIPVIQEAIEILRHFDPKPGSRFSSDSNHYVLPDIVVERTESGEYAIRLTDSEWIPSLKISPRYVQMLKNKAADSTTRDYLRKKLQAADWLRDAVQQRRQTLEKVTRAIVKHQRPFLDLGPDHIQPLKMQQIADQVGVHVTTVSRAVDDKWVETPRGLFPLKRFFVGGTRNEATGEDVAWEKIKQKLMELLDKEDKTNPLSDDDLAKNLQEAGYDVARRTITKYRKLLKIPSSRQRKDWSVVDIKDDNAVAVD
jgi:RNA polymerase sigma-54 factor